MSESFVTYAVQLFSYSPNEFYDHGLVVKNDARGNTGGGGREKGGGEICGIRLTIHEII